MEPLAASSGVSALIRPEIALQGDLAAVLREGRVLSGEVLQTLGGDTVLIGIGGHRVPADTQVELEPGQRFLFRAETEGGKTVLRILPALSGEAALGLLDALRALVGEERPLGALLGDLARLVTRAGAGSADTGGPSLALALERTAGLVRRALTEAGAPPAPRGGFEGIAGSLERALAEVKRQASDPSAPRAASALPQTSFDGPELLARLRTAARVDAVLGRALASLTGGEPALERAASVLGRPGPGTRGAPSAPALDPSASLAFAALAARVASAPYRPGTDGAALAEVLRPVALGYEATLLAAAHLGGRDDARAARAALTEAVAARLATAGVAPLPAADLGRAITAALAALSVGPAEPLDAALLARLSSAFQRALASDVSALGRERAAPIVALEPGSLLAGGEGALLRALLARGSGETADARADVLARAALAAAPADLRGALAEAQLALNEGPVRRALAQAHSALDAAELLDLARHEFGEPARLTFAVPDGEQHATVDLYLGKHRGRRADPDGAGEPFRLTVAVHFTRLGPIRADLLVEEEGLAARLAVARPEVARRVRRASAELEERLAVAGRSVRITVVEDARLEAATEGLAGDIGFLQGRHLMDVEG